jgi:hypothetical protein
MAYGELVITGTLDSSGPLAGTMYEPIATTTVEAEKIPAGQTMTILDENYAVVAEIPEGDYWVRLTPDAEPIHMPAAEFEAQYTPVTP